jgi:amino acid transporter
MGLWAATSIGVGAMIGAGIFALIGIAVEVAGKLAYLAFLIAGFITLLTTYSVAKLAVAFPSKGGPVEYLNRGFGTGILTGSLNTTMWMGYIIVTALYARAFGEYGVALLGIEHCFLCKNLLSSSIVVLFVWVNFIGASLVGKSELLVVGVKVIVLLVFGIMGLTTADVQQFFTTQKGQITDIVLASGIVFMSFEGFGLVANTAEDIKNPGKNLPRALFLSVLIVMLIYALVTLATVGNLSISSILAAKEYVMAEAARPIMGSLGFTVIGIAALFSTSSAINATLYGPMRMAQETARAKQLPDLLTRKLLGHKSGYALVITAVIILIISNTLSLDAIAETGSLIFLVIYTAINAANLRLYRQTQSKRWVIWIAIVGILFSFAALFYFRLTKAGISVYVFLGLFVISLLYEWKIQQPGKA